jgi:hypothetical protein
MVLIRLRKPTAWERTCLSLDPRGDLRSTLLQLGFVVNGNKFSHALIDKTISRTWESPEDVIAFMLQQGIPNATTHLADEDTLQALEWTIRTTHVNWVDVTDAKEQKRGLQPTLTTHIATNETIEEILKKKQVVWEKERYYLAGALDAATATNQQESLLQGVHYVTSLDELRVLLRQTGTLLAPNAKPVGRRSGNQLTQAEQLILELWAATAPYTLPVFGNNNNNNNETATTKGNFMETVKRIVEPEEEESSSESEEESEEEEPVNPFAVAAAVRPTRPTTTASAHPRVSLAGDDDSFDDEDEDDEDMWSPPSTNNNSRRRPKHNPSHNNNNKRSLSKAPASRVSNKKPHWQQQPQATALDNIEWERQRQEIQDYLYQNPTLTSNADAGLAIYQILELQAPGCREYDAIRSTVQRGYAQQQRQQATESSSSSNNLTEIVVQRVIDLLGQPCQSYWEQRMTAAVMAAANMPSELAI